MEILMLIQQLILKLMKIDNKILRVKDKDHYQ